MMATDVPRLRQQTEGQRRAIYQAILEGRAFEAGGLRGVKGRGQAVPYLNPVIYPRAWRDRLIAEDPLYIVWSFRYPVAWYVPPKPIKVWNKYHGHMVDETEPAYWVVPDIRFKSRTTSRHARYARTATILANPITTLDGQRGDPME